MADKSLDIVVRLKDEATKTAQDLKQALGEVKKQAVDSFSSAKQSILDFNKSIENNKAQIQDIAIKSGAVFAGLVASIGVAAKASADLEREQHRLSQTLLTTGLASEQEIKNLLAQADALEKVGVISNEKIIRAQSQLAAFDLTASTIATLTPAILDYAVAEKGAAVSAEDLQQLTNGLAQALQGNFASLTQTGFVLDDYTKSLISTGTEEERAQAIVEVLDSTYEGFNETIRETTEGRMQVLKNQMAGLSVTIGGMFKESVDKLILSFSGVIERIQTFVEENPKLTQTIITAAVAVTGLIAGVTSGLLVFNSLITTLSSLKAVFGVLAPAIGGISAPMLAVIGVVTALGVAWTTNFAGIRDVTMDTWGKMKELFNVWVEVLDALGINSKTLSRVFKDSMDSIATTLYGIKTTFEIVFGALIKLSKWLSDGIISVLTYLGLKTKEGFDGMSESAVSFGGVFRQVYEFMRTVDQSWRGYFAGSVAITKGLIDGDLANAWRGVPEGVRQNFYTAMTIIQEFVNFFIARINDTIATINKFTGGLLAISPVSKAVFGEDVIHSLETMRLGVEDSTSKSGTATEWLKGKFRELGELMTGKMDQVQEKSGDFASIMGENLEGVGGAGKAMADTFSKELEGISKDLDTLAGKIKSIEDNIADVQKQFMEQEKKDRERIAQEIIKQEELISELKSKQRELRNQISKDESGDRRRELRDQLSYVEGQLLTEVQAREEHSKTIKQFDNEVRELREWNSLSSLEQAIKTFESERAAATTAYNEKMALLRQELKEAQETQQTILSNVVNRVDSSIAQYSRDTSAFKSELEKQVRSAENAGRRIASAMSASSGKIIRGARATGGFVQAGNTYLVGERGAELFSPSQSGYITPNNKLAGGGGVTVVVNVAGSVIEERKLANQVLDTFVKELKMSNQLV